MIRNANTSNTGVTYRARRNGTRRLVISFSYIDRDGARRRFRRDARAPSREGALVEARRLMLLAAETGTLLGTAGTPTFLEFVRGAFERDHLPRYKPSTIRRYRDLLRQRLIPHFGPTRLNRVQPRVEAFVGRLARDQVQAKGPVTLLRTVLRAAVKQGIIGKVPDLPKVREAKKVNAAPDEDDCRRMLEGATGYLRRAIALALLAGLRSGEVRALVAENVDLDRNEITVRGTMSDDEVRPPKSGDERVVPICRRLRELLAPALEGLRPRERIVLNTRGKVLTHQALLRRLNDLEVRLGMKRWNFHSLRHAFATRLDQRGASTEAIRVLLGHANVEETQRYLHVSAKELAATVASLDRMD